MNETAAYPRMRWFILIIGCLSFIALQVNMIAFAPLLEQIAQSLRVDLGTATNLMAVFVFAGAISLIVGGFLCDRFGILFVLILGNFFGSVAALLMAWIGSSYQTVLVLRIFEGFAVGFCMCTMSPVVAIWFPPKERGLVGGLFGTSVAVGSAAGVVSAPIVAAAAGNWWSMSAWLSIIGWIALFLTIIVALVPKPRLPSQELAHIPKGNDNIFKKALLLPATWVGFGVTFFAAWIMQTIYNLTPVYLAAGKHVGIGFGPAMSGKLMLSVTVAGIMAPVIGGILQDKVFKNNTRPLMLIGFAFSCLFIYAILIEYFYMNRVFLLICLALAGGGLSIIYPAITVFISGAYPLRIVGKIMGLWFGLGAFGGAVGLFVGGLAVSRFNNYNAAITCISLAALLGFILVLFLKRPKELEG